jgi:hypothetical protein
MLAHMPLSLLGQVQTIMDYVTGPKIPHEVFVLEGDPGSGRGTILTAVVAEVRAGGEVRRLAVRHAGGLGVRRCVHVRVGELLAALTGAGPPSRHPRFLPFLDGAPEQHQRGRCVHAM